MRKYIWPLLTVLLLLADCTAQPSDPTPTVSPEAIKPTSFTLNARDMSFFNPGEFYDLRVKLVPEDAEAEVTWTSSDPNIASVSWNGRVTAISGGTVTITAAIEGLGEQKCIFRCRFTDSATPTPTTTPTPVSEETPTPLPSEDSNLREYFLDVGDGEHSFLVEVKFSGKPRRDFPESDMGLTLSFYAKETDSQPIQVIETGTMMWNERFELVAKDVDFDGDMDFYYSYHEGVRGNTSRSFYIWDEKLECFVDDPYGLGKMLNAGIDEENQAVTDCERGINYERITYYRYNYATMELYPCRALYYGGWEEISNMHVSDYIDGEWVTAFSIESEDVFSGPDYEEFCRWEDLDYHGE